MRIRICIRARTRCDTKGSDRPVPHGTHTHPPYDRTHKRTQVHELLGSEVRARVHACVYVDTRPTDRPIDSRHVSTRTQRAQALKKGEPLTEESIRWLLELHGEMYLIEQHYSTRTRTRRLALNGTPVAVRGCWGCESIDRASER